MIKITYGESDKATVPVPNQIEFNKCVYDRHDTIPSVVCELNAEVGILQAEVKRLKGDPALYLKTFVGMVLSGNAPDYVYVYVHRYTLGTGMSVDMLKAKIKQLEGINQTLDKFLGFIAKDLNVELCDAPIDTTREIRKKIGLHTAEVERLEKELLNKVVGDVLNPTNDLLEAAGFKMTPGEPVSMTYTVEQRDDEFVINDVVYVRADSIKKQTVWVKRCDDVPWNHEYIVCDEFGEQAAQTGYLGHCSRGYLEIIYKDIAEVKEWKPLMDEIDDIKKECGIICDQCGQALPSEGEGDV